MTNLRWWIAGLLFVSSLINYVDRQVLSIVAPSITREFGLSPSGYANIGVAFLVPYTLMYAGSGLLVDRWGARAALAVFMTWWSLAGMLHSLAWNGVSLGVCRFLLGVGEPGNFMAGFRAISEWFGARDRGLANGLLNSGASVGAVIAAPLVAWLTREWGWRAAFVVTGASGFLWLAVWLRLYRTPPPQTATAPVSAPVKPARWLDLLRRRETWSLLLPRFISDPVWWFYLMWLPKYLADRHGFTVDDIGRLLWMPYVAADAGALLGGWLSGMLVRRGYAVLRARRAGMLPFALLMPLSLAIPASNAATAIGIACVVTFAHMAWKTNLQTITNDVFPLPMVGSVSGLIAFGSGLGGMLFTWFTGWTVEHVSYDAIFWIMGFLHPAAYLVFRATLPREAVDAAQN